MTEQSSIKKSQIIENISRQLSDTENDEKITEIDICLTFDRKFLPHAAVTLLSAIRAVGSTCKLNAHILHVDDLDNHARMSLEGLSQNANIFWHQIDGEQFDSLPDNREHISRATYIRLLIPEVLHKLADRVIYLDCDTVVTDRLSRLWTTEIGNSPIAAAPDEGGVTQAERLNFSKTAFYFNAGVLIFNLNAIDPKKFADKITETVSRTDVDIELQDQDILNLMFEGKATKLDLRWNANTRLYTPNNLDPAYSPEEAEIALTFPGILHFTDRRKPWNSNCNHPLRELYWDLRNQTPWRETLGERIQRKTIDLIRSRFSKSRRMVTANN
ncbi:glycosyltransferase family 8 protein [Ruegeria atlantica]|uniref:glycosyltransferase family 8 protein n=1 Tax=Ruegeria atlantica TaxID=81569 RepID=UPI001481D07A|nr:glycosyltransferase family 8 protein [Ruegeria atlantica]